MDPDPGPGLPGPTGMVGPKDRLGHGRFLRIRSLLPDLLGTPGRPYRKRAHGPDRHRHRPERLCLLLVGPLVAGGRLCSSRPARRRGCHGPVRRSVSPGAVGAPEPQGATDGLFRPAGVRDDGTRSRYRRGVASILGNGRGVHAHSGQLPGGCHSAPSPSASPGSQGHSTGTVQPRLQGELSQFEAGDFLRFLFWCELVCLEQLSWLPP